MQRLRPSRPHIISVDDYSDFVVSQVLASDSDIGKRLNAVWQVDTDTRHFELCLYQEQQYVPQKKYADLDEAIAAYNEI